MANGGQFSEKNFVVTGGGSGIGASVACSLAGQGAQVIIIDIDEEGAQKTADKVIAGGSLQPVIIAADVSKEKDMDRVAKILQERCTCLDSLIHCAGLLRFGNRGPQPLVDMTVEEWDAVINVNLKGTFLCNRAVLPAMIRQRNGHIINLSSTSGIQGRAFDSAYCASKHGVIGLSHSLAEEVRQYGVRVNVLLPDAVDTPMWEQNGVLRQSDAALPPERVSKLISFILALPNDTVLGDVVIKVFKTRNRKKNSMG